MRLTSLHPLRPRAAFTLVEMLVALALTIFIMAILSEAFVTGLEAFRKLKAIGDLEERLRTAANIMRRDLAANHFENSKRLSECTVTNRPMPVLDGLPSGVFNAQQALVLEEQLAQYRFRSPAQGFFSIEEWSNRPGVPQNRTTSFFEGQDSNTGRTSYRDQYDVLHFTARLEGNDPSKFFYGKVRTGSPVDGIGRLGGLTRYDSSTSNNLFTSQAAELLYFLGDDDSINIPGVGQQGGPVRTFNLYRQAWLLVPDQFSNGDPVSGGIPSSSPIYDTVFTNFFQDNDLSAALDTMVNGNQAMALNTLSDVQHRVRRRGAGTVRQPKLIPSTGAREGSDILLTNVISFDVKVFDPFAYKIPIGAIPVAASGPASGRGAYVDIGDVYNNVPGTTTPPYTSFPPTAASVPNDALTPVFGGVINNAVADTFDTGTGRLEGIPTAPAVPPSNLSPIQSPFTHRYPITSIQITIRVWEPKTQQTRQITIIQDM